MNDNLDRLIHQPSRLQIMSLLYVAEEADMLYLKKKTKLTWGNISSHLNKLEEAGYIENIKEIVDKKMKTTIKMTKKGKDQYEKYREQIVSILNPDD